MLLSLWVSCLPNTLSSRCRNAAMIGLVLPLATSWGYIVRWIHSTFFAYHSKIGTKVLLFSHIYKKKSSKHRFEPFSLPITNIRYPISDTRYPSQLLSSNLSFSGSSLLCSLYGSSSECISSLLALLCYLSSFCFVGLYFLSE